MDQYDDTTLLRLMRFAGAVSSVAAAIPQTPLPASNSANSGGNSGKKNNEWRGNSKITNKKARRENQPPSTPAAAAPPPSASAPATAAAPSSAVRISNPASSTSRNTLPTVTWADFPAPEDRISLSLSVTVRHDLDVAELTDLVGQFLILCSGIPQQENHFAVFSNCDHLMSLEERHRWIDSLYARGAIPASVAFSRADTRASVISTMPDEDREDLLVLAMASPVISAWPSRLVALRAQCAPVVPMMPAEDVAASPHICTFLTRAQADLLRSCHPIGAVRCFSAHLLDIALNAAMIHRALAGKMTSAHSRLLSVIPSYIRHNITLAHSVSHEIIFRVFISATSVPVEVLLALYGVADEGALSIHPGEIFEAPLPFLLVRSAAMLLGLPYDERMLRINSSGERSLAARSFLTEFNAGPLRNASLAQGLIVLRQIMEEAGLDVRTTVIRVIRRPSSPSFYLLSRVELPAAVSEAFIRYYPSGAMTPRDAFPEEWEPPRHILLNHLQSLVNADFHLRATRPLPHGLPAAGGVATLSPPRDLLASENLRCLTVRVDLLSPRVDSIDSLLAMHDARLTAFDREFADCATSQVQLQQTATAMQSELDELKSVVLTLRVEQDQLLVQHDQLRVSHDQLRSSHEQLRINHGRLRTNHDDICTKHAQLSVTHSQLSDTVETLHTKLFSRLEAVEQALRLGLTPAAPATLQEASNGDDFGDDDEADDEDDAADDDDDDDLDAGQDSPSSSVGNVAVAPESLSVSRITGGITALDVMSPIGILAPTLPSDTLSSSPLIGVGVDILTGSGIDLAPPVVEDDPTDPGLSFAAQLSPSPVIWFPPTTQVSAAWLDMMGYRSVEVGPLDTEDLILSAGMSSTATAFGASFLRISLLLPRVGWGITLLLPSAFKHSVGPRAPSLVDQVLQQGRLTLHRLLPTGAAAAGAPSADDTICWIGTHLAHWLTLADPFSFAELVSMQSAKHLGYHRGQYYSLRAASPLPLHLPSSLLHSAFAFLGERVDLLQASALQALELLSNHSIKLGQYTLHFREGAPASTAGLLLAFSRDSGTLSAKDILGLRCTVTLDIELRQPLYDYVNFNLIHAVADAIRASGTTQPEVHTFLGPATKGPTYVCSSKIAKPKRTLFQNLFTRPVNHPDEAAWDTFIKKMESNTTKFHPEFSDVWLMQNIRDHEWLGQFWRPSSQKSVVCTVNMNVEKLLELPRSPNVCVFTANDSSSFSSASPQYYKASSFQVPSLPADVIERVRASLLERFGPLLPIQPCGRHFPDPLGLDYPPTLN